MAVQKKVAWAKRPASPYKPKADGSSKVELIGGPLNGAWMTMYFPNPAPVVYKTMGAVYVLRQREDLKEEFEAERQLAYQFTGYEEGFSDEELARTSEGKS